MSYLDDLLGKQIKKDGVILPQRKTLNVIGNAAVTVADNPASGETDLTIDTAAPGPNSITTNMIQNLAVTGVKLDTNSVTTSKILDGTITGAKIADSEITFAKMAQLAALSIIGNATNALAVPTAIAAATDGFILRRLGTAIGWGKILTSMITGTATNNNATAGDIGEYVSSTIAIGSATSLVSSTPKTVTSISLTAGDWDVSGVVAFTGSPTTTTTSLSSISTTNNARGAGDANENVVTLPSGNGLCVLPTPVVRLSLASTTTVYLVALQIYTGTAVSAYGTIRARRAR